MIAAYSNPFTFVLSIDANIGKTPSWVAVRAAEFRADSEQAQRYRFGTLCRRSGGTAAAP
ncbi:MAG: hypothetical protein ACI8TX_003749 [Hyphomicrobiaceae bacterium]|jgi:hypothetical protein